MRRIATPLLSLLALSLSLAGLAPAADLPQLQFSPANPQVLKGNSVSLRALLLPPGASTPTADLTRAVHHWTSSDPVVASVDQNGNVQGLSRGTTVITAILGQVAGSTTVRVLAPAVTILPPSISSTRLVLIGVKDAQLNLLNIVSVGDVPLVITSISLTGPNASDFQLSYLTPPVLPLSLPPGSGIQASVNFSPGARGTRTAQVMIVDNAGTQLVPLSAVGTTCLGPIFAAESGDICPDSDGDGFNDAWEMAGGVDFNNDGVVTPDEMIFTNVDPLFPNGQANPHASADPNVKDIFVKYDWMELPDQLTSGQPTACTVNTLPFPGNLFYPYHSDQCAFDQICVSGACRGHSDAPDGAALKMVIDAFAARNIRLHLIKGHALPHSNVTSYGPPIAACIADTAALTFSGSQAVNFNDLEAANFNASFNSQTFSEAQLGPVAHYTVFGHRHTCDSFNDCAQLKCVGGLDGTRQYFDETGYSLKPGNRITVSMGFSRDRNIVPAALALGGTFMHELGHNLGLDHGGPLFVGGVANNQHELNYKPNYLSVMNYSHQTVGINTASPNCAPDDYICKTTAVSVRLDYSSFFNGAVPNTLDENNGSEAAGINVGNNDIGYTWCYLGQTPIPGTGPVDFNCNGNRTQTWCASGCDITPGIELNRDPEGKGQIPNGTPGSGDVLLPFEDWPNLLFPPYITVGGFASFGGSGQALSPPEVTGEQIPPQSNKPKPPARPKSKARSKRN